METEGDDASYVRAQFLRRLNKEGNIRGLESLWSRRDGTKLSVRENATVVRGAAGEVLYYEGTVEEIPNRSMDENQPGQSEETLRSLYESVAQMMGVVELTDPAQGYGEDILHITDNAVSAKGFGLNDPEEMRGQLIGQSAFDVHRDEPDVVNNFQTVLAGSSRSWLYTKQNTTFEMQCRPLFDGEAAPTGLIGVAVDVTERRQLREKIIQSEKLAALGEFVTGIAHEMNNPLAVISGNAQLLALHPEPQVQEDAQAIRSMAERASHIVQSLITFSRRSNNGGAEPGVCSLQTLLTEALLLSKSRLVMAGILLEVPGEVPEIFVKVDKSQLLQVLLNLLSNAEQALRECSEKDKRIVIQIGTDSTLGWLSITDTGIGMSEAVRQRIFDPFFTTKDFGEGAGTGLGLSLCHGIVEAHRGHLAVETEEGNGTTITLYLPLFDIKEISEKN